MKNKSSGVKEQRSGSVDKEAKAEDADSDAIGDAGTVALEKGAEEQQQLNSDEAKKIVESITDSITHGEKPDIEESTKVGLCVLNSLVVIMT